MLISLPMKTIWDISPPVDDNSPVFPGDTPFQREWSARIEANCPVNVARLTLSPHVGAHADAPLHYDTQGLPVGALDLTPYLGPCRLIHALDVGPLIRPEDLKDALGHPPPRVLVRTCRHFPQHTFDAQLSAFAPETIAWLADLGVRLIGIDSASIDPASSTRLPSHQQLRERDMRVLENLYLDEVPPGDYELIALPLKLMTADASPVRAVLRAL